MGMHCQRGGLSIDCVTQTMMTLSLGRMICLEPHPPRAIDNAPNLYCDFIEGHRLTDILMLMDGSSYLTVPAWPAVA